MKASFLAKAWGFSDLPELVLSVPDSHYTRGLKQPVMAVPHPSASLSQNALHQINSPLSLKLSLLQSLRVRTKFHSDFAVVEQA